MRVLSPVGVFPLRVTGVRRQRDGLVVDTAMGAWHSEVRLDREDLPLIFAIVGVVVAAFLFGRLSFSRRC